MSGKLTDCIEQWWNKVSDSHTVEVCVTLQKVITSLWVAAKGSAEYIFYMKKLKKDYILYAHYSGREKLNNGSKEKS